MKKPQFVISGSASNTGKTTVTLALLRALKNRNLTPQSFKCGPDYIDPRFHERAGLQPGINLDLYLMSEAHVHETYAYYSRAAGAICVEGMMGLFDGSKKAIDSTAAMAKSLNLPVVLVVDAKSAAYSVAPLLRGFRDFDPALNIAGVIFNRVNTERHYQLLVEACRDVGIKPFGRLPFLETGQIPAQHLGLSIDQMTQYDRIIENFAEQIERTVDIDALLAHCQTPFIPFRNKVASKVKEELLEVPLKIAIASDEAFNFTYLQNIEALKKIGAVDFFSPVHDAHLPEVDLVYLPGGYPELYLQKLSQNAAMLKHVRSFAKAGGAIIAECGGLMYLGKSITDKTGAVFPMAGVFEFSTSMENMKLSLGYRNVFIDKINFKGHEFHYSTIANDHQTYPPAVISNARGEVVKTNLYRYKNTWASYIHLYFGEGDTLQRLLKVLNNSFF